MSEFNNPNVEESIASEPTYPLAENIIEYFEKYVLTYIPFKEEPVYKAVINHLVRYYLDIIYNYQPKTLKTLYVDQEIPLDTIDLFLVSIGLPQSLIQTLSLSAKSVIFKSFSDFERYKSTIKFIGILGSSFDERVSFYELFVDYDGGFKNPPGEYSILVDKNTLTDGSYFLISSSKVNNYQVWFHIDNSGVKPEQHENYSMIEIEINSEVDTDNSIINKIITALSERIGFLFTAKESILKLYLTNSGYANPPSPGTTGWKILTDVPALDDGSWVLKPYPIYVHPDLDVKTDVLRYVDVYNCVPTLLISEDQYSQLKASNNIIFPSKTNLILIDFSAMSDASLLNMLYNTILMQNVKDDYLSIYFPDGAIFNVEFKIVYYLWYIFLQAYYNRPLEDLPYDYYTVFEYEKSAEELLPLTLLPEIEEAYNKIGNTEGLVQFMDTYIWKNFNRYYSVRRKPNIDAQLNILRGISPDLYYYVIDLLEKITKNDYFEIMDAIYSSFLIYFRNHYDPLVQKYSKYFINNLPTLTVDIKNTNTYKIIYTLKPFHTELIDQVTQGLYIKDKFNAIMFDDYVNFIISDDRESVLAVSDRVEVEFDNKYAPDSLSIIDNVMPVLNQVINDKYNLADEGYVDQISNQYSSLVVSDSNSTSLDTNSVVSSLSLNDTTHSKVVNVTINDKYTINDNVRLI